MNGYQCSHSYLNESFIKFSYKNRGVLIIPENDLRILRIVVIITVIIGLLAVITFAIFGFGLFTTAFVYGLAIWLLIIIILALVILAIYLWIRTFLLKREVKKFEKRLEQAKIELNQCKSKLKQLKK